MERTQPYSGWQRFLARAETRALFGDAVGHVPTNDELHTELTQLAEDMRLLARANISFQYYRTLAFHASSFDEASSIHDEYLTMRKKFNQGRRDYLRWSIPTQSKLLKFERLTFRYQMIKVRCYAELKSRSMIYTHVLSKQAHCPRSELDAAAVRILCHMKAWTVYMREMQAFQGYNTIDGLSDHLQYKPQSEYVLMQNSHKRDVSVLRIEKFDSTLSDQSGVYQCECYVKGMRHVFSLRPRVVLKLPFGREQSYLLCSLSQVCRMIDFFVQQIDPVYQPEKSVFNRKFIESVKKESKDASIDSPLLQDELNDELFLRFGAAKKAFYWRLCGMQSLFYGSMHFQVPVYDVGVAKVLRVTHVQLYVPYTTHLSDGDRIIFPCTEITSGDLIFEADTRMVLQCHVLNLHRKTYRGVYSNKYYEGS